MPKSKGRVKKQKKTQTKNIRAQYRNDARRMMTELFKGKSLLESNVEAYKQMSYVVDPKDNEVNTRALAKLIEKVNSIIVQCDEQATSLRDSTLIEGLSLKQWEEQFLAAATTTSLYLENQVNEVANLVEASLLLMNSVVGGGGVDFKALGFELSEIYTPEELAEKYNDEPVSLCEEEHENGFGPGHHVALTPVNPNESLDDHIERELRSLGDVEKEHGITIMSTADRENFVDEALATRGETKTRQAVDESPYVAE